MPVIIGGHAIIPGPQVNIVKANQTTPDGHWLSATTQIRLTGTLVVEMDGYTSTPKPIEDKLATVLAKQTAFRNLFVPNGQVFEVQGFAGQPPVKMNVIVDSIDFGEGPWTDRSDYTVTMHGESLGGEEVEDDTHCESASESWSFDDGDVIKTKKVVHNLSAKGKMFFNADGTLTKQPWEYARDFVRDNAGFNTTNPPWSTHTGLDLAEDSLSAPLSTNAWNHVVVENIDELDGTYSVTETWILSENSYTENYTVSVKRTADDPFSSTNVSIQGSIQGLYATQNDFDARLVNAKAGWAAIQPLLYSRAVAASPITVTIGNRPIASSSDTLVNEGSITYSFEFSDRKLTGDTYETWTVSRKFGEADYRTTVTVEGTIQGVRYADEADTTIRLTRAMHRWNTVRLLIFSRAIAGSGVTNLVPYPIDTSFSQNQSEGNVSYSYSFDNRPIATVKDEYTATSRYDRSEGRTTISLSGTITGIASTYTEGLIPENNPTERFENANDYWSGIESNLLSRAATAAVNTDSVNPIPYTKEVAKSPAAGTITYNYEYNNLTGPCTPNALSESVQVTDDDSVPVVVVLPVLGRANGPIIQDMGTVSEKRRTVSVDITYPPVPSICEYVPAPTMSVTRFIPTGSRVFKASDQTTWSPSSGKYTRTVSWIYTP